MSAEIKDEVLALLTKRTGWMGDPARGAAMGRPTVSGYFDDHKGEWVDLEVTENAPPFHLRRIPLDNGGYDRGGAYWGRSRGSYLFGFIGPTTDVRGYVRAADRAGAKAAVRKIHPHARFFR